jgi:hypothetical protein
MLSERCGRCLNKNTDFLSQRYGCWIRKNFTKEAAAASIPNDIPSMRGATTTLKKINTFFENSELLGASTKILPMGGGQILMGQNFCSWQWALPKHNSSILFQNTQKYYKQHLQMILSQK